MKKEFEDFIKDFVEGRLVPSVFQNEVTNNSELQNFIDCRFKENLPCPKGWEFSLWAKANIPHLEKYDYSLSIFIMCLDLSKAESRYSLHNYAKTLLPNGTFIPTEKYKKEWLNEFSLEDVLPYVYCPEIVNKIIKELPNVSLTQKRKLLKEKLKTIFKYDNKPPRWLQEPEWAVVDGKPLVFRRQETVHKGNFLKILYYFYDTETKAEIVVEQYD